MKTSTLFIAWISLCVHLQAQSDMMKLRKKVQGTRVQQTQNHLDGVNVALSKYDIPAAERALASAIAQGTLTQTQIDQARAAIQSRSSGIARDRLAQQQAEEARRQAMAQAEEESQRQAEARRQAMAANNSQIQIPPPPQKSTTQPTTATTEESRFRAYWKGKTANFTVTWDNGGDLLRGTKLELQDSGTGKKFLIHYEVGFDKGLFDENVKSAVGATVTVRFDGNGAPVNIKNPANGRGTDTSNGWKVTGYGW